MEKKIREDEDFIHAPKCQNSLNKFLAKLEKPLENGSVGRLLLIPTEQVEEIYQESIVELRKGMTQDEEENEDDIE